MGSEEKADRSSNARFSLDCQSSSLSFSTPFTLFDPRTIDSRPNVDAKAYACFDGQRLESEQALVHAIDRIQSAEECNQLQKEYYFFGSISVRGHTGVTKT